MKRMRYIEYIEKVLKKFEIESPKPLPPDKLLQEEIKDKDDKDKDDINKNFPLFI